MDLVSSSHSGAAPKPNFLATQVWPSARAAAALIEKHADPLWTVCEFGCGPGLPALTAAKMGAEKVYATDLDEFALELVRASACRQGLSERIQTKVFDLVNGGDCFPRADLYILSDVFESSMVAQGAADVSQKALLLGARVWVFAQSDRVQREVYLREMKSGLGEPSLAWIQPRDGPPAQSKLWLCEIDEISVNYG